MNLDKELAELQRRIADIRTASQPLEYLAAAAKQYEFARDLGMRSKTAEEDEVADRETEKALSHLRVAVMEYWENSK